MHSAYRSLAPNFCPAHSWSEPLASTTSFLATLISYFPQILLKTFPTSTGLAAPLHVPSGYQTVSYQGRYCQESKYQLSTQSPYYCGYCLTQPCQRLFKGLASDTFSEAIRVNPRRASSSFCSQSSLPDHLSGNLCIHGFQIVVIDWPKAK